MIRLFMIVGVNNERRQLDYSQAATCRCCKKLSRCEIYVETTVLRLFGIPIAQWNRHYLAVMNCCGAQSILPREIGMNIESGLDVAFDPEMLSYHGSGIRQCAHCGYTLQADFDYCPKCGNKN